MHRLTLSLLLAACLAVRSSLAQVSVDVEQPYTAEFGEPLTVEVDFRVTVTAPHHTERLRVWVPIPPTDSAQDSESLGFETFPMSVDPVLGEEPTFGNRFAYFEFRKPKGAQVIRHRIRVTTREMRWRMDPRDVEPPTSWPGDFAPYLRSDAAVEVTGDVDALVAEVTRSDEPTAISLQSAMGWLQDNMEYDHSNASLAASSGHALQERRGHCSDYHGLCAAFGRSLGYPTRVTYGLALFPKDSPSHCKLEVFLPPYGWVSFDISETQKLIRKIEADSSMSDDDKRDLVAAANRRLHSGYREAPWLLMTRGTDYDLAPPASRRVRVVRTIYAEADGEPLPEPDPADATKREFAWMTSHLYKPSRSITKRYQDRDGLADW